MKKLIALLLALTLCLGMTACGGGTDDTPSSNGGSSASAAESNSGTDDNAGDNASSESNANSEDGTGVEAAQGYTLVEDGVLTMATNAYFPPYEYYEGQEIVGIDVEIAQAVADKLGLTLKVEDMEFDSIITAVQNGRADIGLAGMTVTEDRLKNVDFSTSYATGVQVVIVTKDSDIKTLDDLYGDDVMIGVQLSTTGDIYASDTVENGGFGADHVEEFNKGNDAVMALLSGKISAVIIDNEPAKAYVAANADDLTILDTEYVTENYAACLSKDNTALTEAVTNAIDELIEDGTIQGILDKYITND
jgi:polar amino acid transport system substrate-binding protein